MNSKPVKSIRRLVIGISGGSGPIYGVRLLQVLKELGIETHLVMSEWGVKTIRYETDWAPERVKSLASYDYDDRDLAARISSGSFRHDGMIVIPCSMKTLAGITSGYAENLLLRAVDVTLKEGRKLVLVVRETPLNRIHIKNMLEACDAGAIILPAMPPFYTQPKTIQDMIDSIVGKTLDQFDIEHDLYKRWRPLPQKKSA